MARPLYLFFALLSAASLFAADATPPPLTALTYSGDQSALEALDRDVTAAGTDPAKLAALETRLLALLRRTDATFAARQAICQRLGAVLAQSAPKSEAAAFRPLDTMLSDERDCDLARLALEPVRGAVVDALFSTAIGKTSGRNRLALIDSVVRRQSPGAVATLTPLLADKDTATASAAARALGKLGGPAALVALQGAVGIEAGLLATSRLEAATSLPKADALRALREMQDDSGLPNHLRASAFRSSLELDRDAATNRIVEILGGSDWSFKEVALEATNAIRTRERASALAAKLSSWDAPTQIAVIAALARDGEAVAVPAIVTATQHGEAGVRAEALTALGALPGSRDVANLLARVVATANGTDAKLARQSLSRLNGPDVSPAILAGAERGEADLRIAFLEQLALRNMTEGLPVLLKCRHESNPKIRTAAVGALGDLAPATEQGALIDWAVAATDDAEQTRALRSLVNVTLRHPVVAERGRAVYAAIEGARPEVALRLLPALARIGGAASADCAARLAVRDDAKVAEAAVAILGRWTDATALPALATVTEKGAIATVRDSARENVLRYFERSREPWTPATTSVVSRLLTATKEPAPRHKLVLLLARANDKTALKVADDLKSDSTLGDDARYAAAVIRANLAGKPKVRASTPEGTSNLFDGKTSTRWTAPALGEEWVEIDFRLSRPLRRLTLDQTGRAAEFPEHYEVYVTDDAKQPGKSLASGAGKSNKTVIELPAGTLGRYVIIKNTAERKDTPWAICELYVD